LRRDIGQLVALFLGGIAVAQPMLCNYYVLVWQSLGLLPKMTMQLHRIYTFFFSWMPPYARCRGISEGGKNNVVYFNLGNLP
jgi:hypothetical protein